MIGTLLISGYSLTFTNPALWIVVLLFLVVLGLTVLYYRRTNPPLELSRRLILGTLRGIAVAALFFAFAEPLLTLVMNELKAPTLALVIDNSSSMATNRNSAEQFAGITDYIRTVESRVTEPVEIVQYLLSDTVIAGQEITGTAAATAIGDGLTYLAADLKEQNLQGVVLFSDGASNLGSNPAAAAKSLGVPVYTIGFGSPEPLADIAVTDLTYNPVGFADKEYEIEVVVESRGYESSRVPVRVRHRGRNLTQENIDLLGQGRRQSTRLAFTPPGEGVYTLEISVPSQENEQTERNNSRQIQVRFRKSRIKILLAAAALSWDHKFIKQALEGLSDFEVSTAISSSRRISGTVPFPENLDALSEYDVLVLSDFEASWFTARRQLLDAFFDRTGKGVFVLAGENFGRRGSDEYTRALFPYRIIADRRIMVQQEVPVMPTQEGRIHPILQLTEDSDANDRMLDAMPPFAGYLMADEAAAKATILAEIPSEKLGGLSTPLLGVHRYRTGKVTLLTALPFWKLDFLAKSFNENDSSFAAIVENTVLWLVARDDLERINITTQRPIFVAGETVELTSRVLDESYLPVTGAEVEALLLNDAAPDDTIIVSFTAGRPGSYATSLNYLAPGSYQVKGTAKRDGVLLGRPQASFVIEPYSLEDLSQIADFDRLKRISEVSGGAFYPASDTAAMPQFPELPERQLTRRSELSLFDYPAVLIVFLVAICAEWILRRKYQLL